MKRFLTLALAGALVLGMGSVAYANICAFDPVPAATLLFPFVTYNYDAGLAGNGSTTLWSVTNVSSEAQIVHVTLWTDFSKTVLDFNILLTGYDMQTGNIRDILRDGHLPVTYWEDHEGSEGIVDNGPWSRANGFSPINPAFPEPTDVLDCDPDNPAYPGRYTTAIPANILGVFQTALQASQTADRGDESCVTGATSSLGTWFEDRTTADDTWMYMTMDVVTVCNKEFPDSTGYFVTTSPGLGAPNVLVGDYTTVNNDERFSEVDNAVHIEAGPTVETIGPNDFPITFYGRYSNKDQVTDYREPLPTAWAVRYTNTTLGDGSMLETYLRVFKTNTSTVYSIVPDLDFVSTAEMYSRFCLAYTYYVWDDEENVQQTTTFPWSGGEQPGGVVPNLLPLETQEVNAADFALVGPDGWMMFVWPASNGAIYNGVPVFYQTWMGVKYVNSGKYSGAKDAQVLANYNCFADEVLPQLGIGKYVFAE